MGCCFSPCSERALGATAQSALPAFPSEIGNGYGDQGIDAGRQVEGDTPCKYAQQRPDHGPAVERSRFFGLGGHLGQARRLACYGIFLFVPFRIPYRITINFLVTQFYGYPSRRVASDSCKPRSVKNNGTVFIRSEEFLHRIPFFPP